MRTIHAVLGALLLLASCGKEAGLVAYIATDQHTSERIVRLFEQRTGIKVRARYDTEANKTVGLVTALVEEADNPRADVFWNNEIVHTIRLMGQHVFRVHDWPTAADIPDRYKCPGGHYVGFAARARILIVNTEKLKDPGERPSSMWDLCDPRFKGKAAMARPLTGTTLTHVAALYATLGEEKARAFLDGMKKNEVYFAKSNGAVMRIVAGKDGPAFGFTDTDDFNVARRKGFPVLAVYPDQDGIGTFVIPNTVALVKGGPHPENARKFADFLVSREVEEILAASPSAQIPLHPDAKAPDQVRPFSSFKAAEWDPVKTAETMDRILPELRKRFGR